MQTHWYSLYKKYNNQDELYLENTQNTNEDELIKYQS